MPADKPLGSFSTSANVSTFTHAADLVWAYEFDGTVSASVSSGLQPDIGPSLTALNWGGTYQSVTAPHLRGIPDANRGNVTDNISFGTFELGWYYTGTGTTYAELLGSYGTGRFIFEFNGSVFKIFDSGGFTGETSSFSYTPTANDFVHAFVVWSSGSFKLRVYVNGTLLGSSTHSSGSYNSSQEPFSSGSVAGNCVFFRHYNAQLTDAQMDQNALTSDEEPYAVVGATLASAGEEVTFAGTSSSATVGSGVLEVARVFGGTAETAAQAEGAVAVARAVGGTAQTAARADGAADVARVFGGTSQAATVGSGDVTVTEPGGEEVTFAGTSSAAAVGSGAVAVARVLGGTAQAAAIGSGDFDVEEANAVTFAGTSSSASVGSGALAVARALGGVSEISVRGTGRAAVTRPLGGTLSAATIGSGNVSLGESLVGQPTVESSAAGLSGASSAHGLTGVGSASGLTA
jgi:hypothetical protein